MNLSDRDSFNLSQVLTILVNESLRQQKKINALTIRCFNYFFINYPRV